MADCTCADPQAVVNALKNEVAGGHSNDTTFIDQTLYGSELDGDAKGTGATGTTASPQGKHGAMGPFRFCHWAAPEYGTQGETLWTNFFQAAQLAIAILNATLQGQIADKQQDLAESYYDMAKYKWDRFANKYMPLEKALLKEVSTEAEPEMDCDDDRERAENAVNLSYDFIQSYISRMMKALRVCVDASALSQLEYGRNLMLVDTENYNLRDDVWYTDYKSDKRWGRRSNVLNLGRNLGSVAMQYADAALAAMNDVGGLANKAASSLSSALGYYGARNDTYYPTNYLAGYGGSAVQLANTASSGTSSSATGGAAYGF